MENPEATCEQHWQDASGTLSRKHFVRRMGAIGASAAAAGALLPARRPDGVQAAQSEAGFSQASLSEQVTIVCDSWFTAVNPVVYQLVKSYNAMHPDRKPVLLKLAPAGTTPTATLVSEARRHTSYWDAFFGATPFVDNGQLYAAGAIEPWDPYVSSALISDLFPAVRKESSIAGKLFQFPLLLDTVGYAYRKDYFKLAGIAKPPATWEDYIAAARTIGTKLVRHQPRVYGGACDLTAWPTFIPIAYSIDTNIYTRDGYLDWAHKEQVFRKALTYMKEIVAYAPPDIFKPGSAVTGSADEAEFRSGRAAMLLKYYNAAVRGAKTFGVQNLGLAPLPKPGAGGAGATVFWNTGVVLLKYGRHKQEVADFFAFLTYNQQFWRSSMFNGQPPCVKSAYDKVLKPWAPRYLDEVVAVLPASRAIPTAANNNAQFDALQAAYMPYLKGQISLDTAISDGKVRTRKAIATGVA